MGRELKIRTRIGGEGIEGSRKGGTGNLKVKLRYKIIKRGSIINHQPNLFFIKRKRPEIKDKTPRSVIGIIQ